MTLNHFAKLGYCIGAPMVSDSDLEAISVSQSAIDPAGAGSRRMLEHGWCVQLASQLQRHFINAHLLDGDAVAVQCTYFDKSPGRNWLVPLHQDLSIPVQQEVEHPALTGWSEKEGVMFVQPPLALLERLVAFRLHIDECGIGDGALSVVPGSHRMGRLSSAEAANARAVHGAVLCPVARGAVMALSPMLLHASSKSTGAGRRRVLHFVFGPAQLPFGLRWPDRL